MVKDAVSPSTGQPLTFGLRAAWYFCQKFPSIFAPRTKKQVPSENFEGIEGFTVLHGMSKGGIAGPAHC